MPKASQTAVLKALKDLEKSVSELKGSVTAYNLYVEQAKDKAVLGKIKKSISKKI